MNIEQPSPAQQAGPIYPLVRIAASLALMTVGAAAMYANMVVLYPLTVEFEISRGWASFPYMLFMLGFGLGGVIMGRVVDRFGIFWPVIGSTGVLTGSMIWASYAESVWHVALTVGLLSGLFGASTTFGPLVADISHWFHRRRGMAVAIVISGNYLAGAIWPPIMQSFIDRQGWRETFFDMAIVVAIAMVPLALLVYRKTPKSEDPLPAGSRAEGKRPPLSSKRLQALLCVGGVGCCVAMAMPQVHIVPLMVDHGFSPSDGARMLSVMLGCGIISRLVSGWISDRIGGLLTLLLGSLMQMLVLIAFLGGETLTGFYLLSAVFGLSQGGIVPSYTIIIRSFFPAAQAGWRIGFTLLFTMIGMALGGWVAGALYDLTGSYTLSFLNAIAFNLMNMLIATYIYLRMRPGGQRQTATAQA